MMRQSEALDALQQVKQYYGQTLKTNDDLKTGACCSTEGLPAYIKSVLCEIDDEISEKFYGCGSPIPLELGGKTVLDLGCGTGRDVYVISKLVGPEGKVIGVDMTEQQLEVARRHVESQTQRFGFAKPNVEFHQGYIEDLGAVGIEDDSVDIVISNCVINLSPDKNCVFAEIFRVLKPGGELYFSDVFADRRIPNHWAQDPVLLGECLSGAMYAGDFRRMLCELGCADSRQMARNPVSVNDPDLAGKIGMIRFHSLTIRAFKIDGLEEQCEDYGQIVTYRGTIAESPHAFTLDDHHTFSTGKPMTVCGNTAAMLQDTRFAKHFSIQGDRSTHFGLFNCGTGSCDSSDTPACC